MTAIWRNDECKEKLETKILMVLQYISSSSLELTAKIEKRLVTSD